MVTNRLYNDQKSTQLDPMVGKSKSGFGFKSGFSYFAKSVDLDLDLNIFNTSDLDLSFLKRWI